VDMDRGLWLALAATLPLFGVEFWRYNDPALKLDIAAPLLIVCVVVGIGWMSGLRRRLAGREFAPAVSETPPDWWLAAALFAFVGWHLFGWIRASDPVPAMRELLKIGLGALVLWGTLTFFPRDRRFLEVFWTTSLWACWLLVAALFLRYAFVFRATFLGIQLEAESATGRNLLAWVLMPMFLCALFRACAFRRSVDVPPLVFLAAGLLYIGSRGAWISVLVGLAVSAVVSGLRRFRACLLVAAATLVVAWLFLVLAVPAALQFPRRALFLLSPGSVPELHTYEIRLKLIRDALACFRESPVIGLGLVGTERCINFAPHNDYVAVLGDLGVVGLLLFVGILGIITLRLIGGQPVGDGAPWLAQMSCGALAAMLVSISALGMYSTPVFWLLLGLFLVEARSRMAETALRSPVGG